jgi:hypothetical protein
MSHIQIFIEILDLFQVVHFDQYLLQKNDEYLLAYKNYGTLVKFVLLFDTKVESNFEEILHEIKASKDWSSTELFVRSMAFPSKSSTSCSGSKFLLFF